MKKALFRKMGPLAWLIPDNLDNRKNLRDVVAGGSVPKITIIHGAKDSTIPLFMAQQLKDIAPNEVTLVTVDDGTHVSILKTHMNDTFKKLLED